MHGDTPGMGSIPMARSSLHMPAWPASAGRPAILRVRGEVPKWPNGADCKSAGYRLQWFESTPLHHPCPQGLTQSHRKQCSTRSYARTPFGEAVSGRVEGEHNHEDDHNPPHGRSVVSVAGRRRVALALAAGRRVRTGATAGGRQKLRVAVMPVRIPSGAEIWKQVTLYECSSE